MQPLKETEGMGDTPPNHWPKNLRNRVFSTGYFSAYICLGLRTSKRRGALRNAVWKRVGRVRDQIILRLSGLYKG